MGYVFDGTNKIINLTSGTTALDVRDLYSRWKDWMLAGGAKYFHAFEVVGGEPIDEANGIYITSYFFLVNGWKVKPQEADHKLKVSNGILLEAGGGDPFIPTDGSYNVLVQYSQPIKSETVRISTGSGLSPEEHNKLMSLPGLNQIEESNVIAKQSSIEALIDMIRFLVRCVKNKKYLEKIDTTWYLVIRNDNDTGDLVRKELKDKNGNDIMDIQAGILAQELESSV